MLVIKCCIRLWAIRRGYTQEWDCFDCGLLGRRLFNPFCGVLVRTLWVMAAAVAGQTHVALTWRTPAVIGCEKTIQKDRMQSVVWAEKFSCYLVLNTQPYLSFHRGVYFSKKLLCCILFHNTEKIWILAFIIIPSSFGQFDRERSTNLNSVWHLKLFNFNLVNPAEAL